MEVERLGVRTYDADSANVDVSEACRACRVEVGAVHFVAREVRQETDVVSSGAS